MAYLQYLPTADIDKFFRQFVHCAVLLVMATPVQKNIHNGCRINAAAEASYDRISVIFGVSFVDARCCFCTFVGTHTYRLHSCYVIDDLAQPEVYDMVSCSAHGSNGLQSYCRPAVVSLKRTA